HHLAILEGDGDDVRLPLHGQDAGLALTGDHLQDLRQLEDLETSFDGHARGPVQLYQGERRRDRSPRLHRGSAQRDAALAGARAGSLAFPLPTGARQTVVSKDLKVTDKRIFTPEGELREEFRHLQD